MKNHSPLFDPMHYATLPANVVRTDMFVRKSPSTGPHNQVVPIGAAKADLSDFANSQLTADVVLANCTTRLKLG